MNSHRRARFISEVDRRLIEKGLDPSWKDRVTHEDQIAGLGAPDPEDIAAPMGAEKNDEALRENVPPHWHARL